MDKETASEEKKIMTDTTIKETGLKMNEMGREQLFGRLVKDMKEILLIISVKEWVNIFTKMDQNIKANFQLIKSMEKESLNLRNRTNFMSLLTRVNSKMMNSMGMVIINMRMEIFMKDSLKTD